MLKHIIKQGDIAFCGVTVPHSAWGYANITEADADQQGESRYPPCTVCFELARGEQQQQRGSAPSTGSLPD